MTLETILKLLPGTCKAIRWLTGKKPVAPKVLWALIVEDNKYDAELNELVLLRCGFQVQKVPSGEVAQGLIARETYDLILVDLQLPGMSGAALLRILSNDAPFARVVVVTGEPSDLPVSEPIVVVRKPITDDSIKKIMKLLPART